MSAGYVPGVPRLGVPALLMSDASLGVTNPGYRPATRRPRCRPASRWARASTRRSRARPARLVGREARVRGLQRAARGRDQPRARPAQRAQLRVPLRGSAAERRARRRVDRRHPGRRRDLDDQALLAQLQRDQPPLARRDHRPGRAPRVRPAGVRDRDRARAAGLGHDRLQQDQRRLRGRQPRADQGRPQGRVGLPGLGDVRLGRHAELGVRARGARPGVRRPDRRADLGRRSRSASRSARPTPTGRLPKERLSEMVRRILRSIYAVGIDALGRPRPRSTRPRTSRSRSRPRARASCC